MPQLEQARVLLIEAQGLALLVDSLHALEQRVVERDGVELARQHRVDLGLQCPEFVIDVRTGDVAEGAGNTIQRLAREFERDDRVREGRRFGVAYDRIDVGAQLEDALLDRRHVVRVLDSGERRHAIGRIPFLQERVPGEFRCRHRDLIRRGRRRGVLVPGLLAATACREHDGDQPQANQAVEFHVVPFSWIAFCGAEDGAPSCSSAPHCTAFRTTKSSPCQGSETAYVYTVPIRYKRFTPKRLAALTRPVTAGIRHVSGCNSAARAVTGGNRRRLLWAGRAAPCRPARHPCPDRIRRDDDCRSRQPHRALTW